MIACSEQAPSDTQPLQQPASKSFIDLENNAGWVRPTASWKRRALHGGNAASSCGYGLIPSRD